MQRTDERHGTTDRARSTLGGVGKALAQPVAVIVVAAATAVAAIVAGTVGGASSTTVLLVVLIGLVVIAILRSNRQHRYNQWHLSQLIEAGQEHTDERLGRHERQLQELGERLDQQLERRLTDHLARERQASNAGVERLAKAIARCEDYGKLVTRQENANAYKGVEALLNLYAMVPIGNRVPPMRGWAASPDVLLLLVSILRNERPKLVVECGSGLSTLWSALAMRQFGIDGKVVALEHDADYARRTVELLTAHGVQDLAEVRHAPLTPIDVAGETYHWYAADAWRDLDGIGLLFVDGPPADTGAHARFPAMPLLGDRLGEDAVVVLDDLIRKDEQEVVQLWRDTAPSITEERLKLEKDASVLRSTWPGSWTSAEPRERQTIA
ncbi:class I SAM-dependent methyltransferase [Micromonospora mirobrigensis]|uniref:Methyltransferase domain-containing protein n=1 Tax=Micromonospora mirobrigensis TaxID=262898 RepID=A0A1C4UGP0_9ACTN|nr:class I SAM-dependent methyltransferase [Micromonospora mirobrigensis]SCE70838.1 Methyltransferase domain-containing protein [Micromonospora mirobrigensis]